MPIFRAFILALHAPSSEIQNYGKDFNNMEDAVSRPYWLLDQLQKDMGEQFRCHSWAQPRVHQQFFVGCFFQLGGGDGIVGMVMVMALEGGNDSRY
jgi:hypothetical protein